MKAVLVNQYRKVGTGNLVLVYAVQGTAKDIAAYNKAKAERLGIPESELKGDAKGNPLFHYSPNLAQGRLPAKSLNLAISFGGKVVVDDINDVIAKAQRIDGLMEIEEAKHLVQVKYGNASVVSRTTTASQPAAEVATANEEPSDELDNAVVALQGAGAGTEKLGE